MGGTITVESEKGRGSTFIFTVRCLQLSSLEEQQLIQPLLKETKSEIQSVESPVFLNILIVEDNIINQRILARFLKTKGFSSITNSLKQKDLSPAISSISFDEQKKVSIPVIAYPSTLFSLKKRRNMNPATLDRKKHPRN